MILMIPNHLKAKTVEEFLNRRLADAEVTKIQFLEHFVLIQYDVVKPKGLWL